MQSAPGPAVAFDAVGLARDRVVVDATTPAWLRFVVVMFVILIPRLAGLHSLNIYDDAFITFRHADNLATGDGLTFNRGTRVLGTTSPLLAVWLAGARITGLDIPSTARTTAIVSDVVTGLLTYGLLHRTFGPMAGLAGIALFALEPY